MELILWLAFFQVKHFAADFLYQPPWMYENKGTYMHAGGLAHSGGHAFLSFCFMAVFISFEGAALIAFCEFLAHYHIDWAKMKLNDRYGWKPTNSANFWRLLGLDQLLHQITYLCMVIAMIIDAVRYV